MLTLSWLNRVFFPVLTTASLEVSAQVLSFRSSVCLSWVCRMWDMCTLLTGGVYRSPFPLPKSPGTVPSCFPPFCSLNHSPPLTTHGPLQPLPYSPISLSVLVPVSFCGLVYMYASPSTVPIQATRLEFLLTFQQVLFHRTACAVSESNSKHQPLDL